MADEHASIPASKLVARSQRSDGVSAALADKQRASNVPTDRIQAGRRDLSVTYDFDMSLPSLESPGRLLFCQRQNFCSISIVDNLVSPWVWLSSQRAPPHRRFSRQQASRAYCGIAGEKFCKSAGDVRDAHVSSHRGELCVCIAAPRASWPVDAADPRRTSNRIGDVCAHSDGHEVLT